MTAVCGTAVAVCSRRFVTAHTVTNSTGIFSAAQRRALGGRRFRRNNRYDLSIRSDFLLFPAFASRFRQRRLSSPHRWSFASTLLAFQSQPPMHFLQTIGILAVPLIAGRRNVLTVTALPQTKSRWKSRFPRRRGISGAMVDEFHGRSCSHWIRPNGCLEPFGHFF